MGEAMSNNSAAWIEAMRPTHSYVAHRRCGCPVAIRYDEPSRPGETGRWVGSEIKNGHYIERVALADLLHIELGCIHRMEVPDVAST